MLLATLSIFNNLVLIKVVLTEVGNKLSMCYDCSFGKSRCKDIDPKWTRMHYLVFMLLPTFDLLVLVGGIDFY